MSSVEVRDMLPEDEYFVSTCTHENESEEIDASANRRLAWLRSREPDGLRVKVALREVAAEFGDRVVLRDYCGDDRDTLLKHQIPRAIYVQGNEIGWGYEAPRDGIGAAIRAALERADTGEA